MNAMLGCQKSQTSAQICHKILEIFSYEAIHWFVNEKLSETSCAESKVSLFSSAWLALPWPFMCSANTLLGQVPKPTMMTRITPLISSAPSPYNRSSWWFPSIFNHLPGFPSTFRVTCFLLWLFWAHCQLALTSAYVRDVCISQRFSSPSAILATWHFTGPVNSHSPLHKGMVTQTPPVACWCPYRNWNPYYTSYYDGESRLIPFPFSKPHHWVLRVYCFCLWKIHGKKIFSWHLNKIGFWVIAEASLFQISFLWNFVWFCDSFQPIF